MSAAPPVPLGPEDELLLACARLEMDAALRRRVEALAAGRVDWALLQAKAVRQGVATLAAHHLRGVAVACHRAPEMMAALEAAQHQARLQAMRQRHEAGRVAERLRGRGVAALALKGLALREGVYPDPALRPSGDVDLLVRLGEAHEAEAVLQELGYRPDESGHPKEWFRPEVNQHLVPYLLPERQVLVEVHWDLAPPKAGLAVDVEGLWARAEPAPARGLRLGRLAAADTLLHLCLHLGAVGHFGSGLRHVVDVAEVARAWAHRLDWAEVAGRAAQWRAERWAYAALRLAAEVLGAPVPAAVVEGLRPAGFDERVMAVVWRRLLDAGEARGPEGDGLFPPEVGGAERARVMWRNLFPPRGRMAEIRGLPAGRARLAAAYAARPAELLARYLRGRWAARRGRLHGAAEARFMMEDALLDRWLGFAPGAEE